MPTISCFYGISIRMFFFAGEHNPPHFHAYYGENEVAIDIRTLQTLDGELPHRAMSLVNEWALEHQDELMHIWETQQFERIAPLS